MRVGGKIEKIDTDLSCEKMATIPFTTIDTIDGLTRVADGFVHVTSNNTIYYIDGKHRIGQVWAGVLEDPDYDVDQNPNNLRSQFLSTTAVDEQGELKNVMVFFDKDGKSYVVNTEGEGAIIYDELKELIDEEAAERAAQDDYTRGLLGSKQDRLIAGTGISIDGSVISNSGVTSLVAGDNVQIEPVAEGMPRISATDTQYSAGEGIRIDGNNVISLDQALKQGWGVADSANSYLSDHIAPNDTISMSFDISDLGFENINDYFAVVVPEKTDPYDPWQSMECVWDKESSTTTTLVVRIHSKVSSGYVPMTSKFRYIIFAKGYGGGGGGSVTLYHTTGQHTDGAMTQKATTDALNGLSQNLTNVQVNLQQQIDAKPSASDLSGKQDALTAGSNIQINGNVISATDTTYTAGNGISISAGNVISATGGAGGVQLVTGTTDIGEGIVLPENTIYGVYE